MKDADFFYIRVPLSGCSLVRLKRTSGGRESEGSNPSIPTNQSQKIFFDFLAFLF